MADTHTQIKKTLNEQRATKTLDRYFGATSW